MHALAAARLRSLEDWLLAHARRHLSDHIASKNDTELREAIRAGITRARAYGAETQSAICKYVDLRLVLGEDFEENPAHPWAARILRGTARVSPDERLQALCAAALQHLSLEEEREPSEASSPCED